jgi:hypothetical protein
MKITKIAMLAIIMIGLLPIAYGIGVSPSSTQEYFEAGLDTYVNLKLTNPTGEHLRVTAYAEGDLEDYISFPVGSLEIHADEKERMFTYRISLPKEMKRKGEIKTEIIILALPEGSMGDTQIQSSTEVVHRLELIVPISDLYAEARLFLPEFQTGAESNIIVEARNYGIKPIANAVAIIDIYDGSGNKLLFLKSEAVPIQPKEMKSIVIPWKPNLPGGVYKAHMTFLYDNKNAMEEKTFTIGGPNILIKEISVDNFNLGGIAKFEILLESEWNRKIESLYGVVNVLDKSDKTLTAFKTPAIDIDAFGIQNLEAYWDTDKVTAGDYKLKIDLNYLGKTTEEIFEVKVLPNSISIGATGKAVTAGDKEAGTLNVITLLVLVVLLLVGIIGFLIFKRKK